MVDPKTPLYRYVSFDRFNQMLFSKELTLVSPSKWDDDFELYWIKMLNTPEGEKRLLEFVKPFDGDAEKNITRIMQLSDYMYRRVYCLCFSKARDAEVLWRANANDNRGIMFATTANKLYDLLPESDDIALEEVQYDLDTANMSDQFLKSFRICSKSTLFSNPDNLFSHKRKCFSYEEEVRLIVSPETAPEDRILKRPIPNLCTLIDGVMVHPLANKEFVSLVELLCSHFNLAFWGQSTVYQFKPLQ